jgi:hypothetical protein
MLNSISCSDCHSDIHAVTSWKKDKRKVIEKCQQCHDQEASDFLQSSHGKSLMAGNQDSPSCSDCHGLHEIKPRGEENTAQNTQFHSMACMKCHSDEKMMKRNGVFTLAVETYEESYHGKNYRLVPWLVAVAPTAIQRTWSPHQRPRSSISSNRQNLPEMPCKGVNAIPPIPWRSVQPREISDPLLDINSMSALLAELSQSSGCTPSSGCSVARGKPPEAALEDGHEDRVADGHKQYRRFSRLHIFLHLLVITSFLGLAFTGLPLKFSSQDWARVMMDMMGGTANAALIHRISAIVTFVYFLTAIIMSLRFLFIRKDIPELVPASLRTGFPFEHARYQGYHRDVPLVPVQRTEANLRALDILGKIRLPGRLLGDVCHRRFRPDALVPGILRQLPAWLGV